MLPTAHMQLVLPYMRTMLYTPAARSLHASHCRCVPLHLPASHVHVYDNLATVQALHTTMPLCM
jgi:hypothetical protein